METMVKNKNVNKEPEKLASVFIVDDDVSYLHPLIFHLQKGTKYKIDCFTNGEECVKNMQLKPGIVILDYNLNPQSPNKLNGIDVLRQIKNMYPKTKVIMLSGRDEYQSVLETLKLGAYTYVLKDTEALETIKRLLLLLCNNSGKDTSEIVTDT